MSLTLVTGVPGSGKTLYSIEKLLMPILGTTVKRTRDDGTEEEIPRIVYTNINGLQLDHELIDFNGMLTQKAGAWEHVQDPKRPGEELHRKGIHHWHEWAKPGAFLFLDEFQKAWPPRPNGASVPPDIQALDTHRHMGVDMVLITQSVNNIDRHVLGLVDRHLHIRRFGNMPAAVVYEWDHASRSLLYKNAIKKSPWRYDKKVFKLYKSAEVHTKQRRNIPTLVWFILAGLVSLTYFVPTTYERLYARTHPEPVKPAQSLVVQDEPAQGVQPAQTASSGTAVPVVPVSGEGDSAPVFAGCLKAKTACVCYTTAGAKVDREPGFCEGETSPNPVQLGIADEPKGGRPAADWGQLDGQMVKRMRAQDFTL